jgi:hypothetical protein
LELFIIGLLCEVTLTAFVMDLIVALLDLVKNYIFYYII